MKGRRKAEMAGTATGRVYLMSDQLQGRIPGGIGTHTTALLGSLSRLCDEYPDLELIIVSPLPKRPDIFSKFALPVRYLPLSRSQLVAFSNLRLPVMGLRDGVYHSFSIFSPPLFLARSRVVTVHDLAFRSNPEFFTKRGLSWHESQLAALSSNRDSLVAVSCSTRDALLRAGIASTRISVIESGTDHMPPPDIEGAKRLVAELGVEGRFLLSVSTLEPRKNLANLVAGFDLALKELLPGPDLVVVGPDGWKNELEGSSRVCIAGSVPQEVLSGLYHLASALVYVPFEEGFGLPIVEAMRAGTPVVSSDVPSAQGASELVDPASRHSIAAGIVRVMTDQALRNDLIRRGAERVSDATWDRAARQHLDLWRKIQQ